MTNVGHWIFGTSARISAQAIVFMKPVSELLWPAFRDGDLSLNHQTMVSGSAEPSNLRGGRIPHAAWNLGEVAGLHGRASLVPLGLVWIAAAALF